MLTPRSLLLLVVLVACRRDDDPVDSALPCAEASPELVSDAFVAVPSGEAVDVEVEDGQTWRVVADGDCVRPEEGEELCPVWDFSDDHEVVDGHLSTVGGPFGGFVVNLTDREWRVYRE